MRKMIHLALSAILGCVASCAILTFAEFVINAQSGPPVPPSLTIVKNNTNKVVFTIDHAVGSVPVVRTEATVVTNVIEVRSSPDFPLVHSRYATLQTNIIHTVEFEGKTNSYVLKILPIHDVIWLGQTNLPPAPPIQGPSYVAPYSPAIKNGR